MRQIAGAIDIAERAPGTRLRIVHVDAPGHRMVMTS